MLPLLCAPPAAGAADAAAPGVGPSSRAAAATRPPGFVNYVESGGLDAVLRRGTLRLLVAGGRARCGIERRHAAERAFLGALRDALGVALAWVCVEHRAELAPALLAGRGDLVLDDLSATPDAGRVRLSLPHIVARQWVITREGDAPARTPAQLAGMRVAAPRHGHAWLQLLAWRRRHPGIVAFGSAEGTPPGALAERLAQGRYDAVLIPGDAWDAIAVHHPDLQVAFAAGDDASLRWAVRPGAGALLATIDRHLNAAQRALRLPTIRHGDLPGIRASGVLRVLARPLPGSFFLDRGQLRGFELDLLERFAKRERLDLEVIVPPPGADPVDWLRDGRGDLIGLPLAPATVAAERGVVATRPYRVSGTPRNAAGPPWAPPAAERRVWATRNDSPELRERLDAFIEEEYRGVRYNVLRERYLDAGPPASGGDRAAPSLSPYDELVKPLAEEFGFDWRLIVAQMFEESRFDPRARSPAGALGLLQVMPATGRELGFENLTEPGKGLRAGVTYLARVRDRFERDLPVNERPWFALAAYNTGFARVRAARRLAGELGLDADRWFGNVELALARLPDARSPVARGHRRCRCDRPVRYVREIRARYAAYSHLATGGAEQHAAIAAEARVRVATRPRDRRAGERG